MKKISTITVIVATIVATATIITSTRKPQTFSSSESESQKPIDAVETQQSYTETIWYPTYLSSCWMPPEGESGTPVITGPIMYNDYLVSFDGQNYCRFDDFYTTLRQKKNTPIGEQNVQCSISNDGYSIYIEYVPRYINTEEPTKVTVYVIAPNGKTGYFPALTTPGYNEIFSAVNMPPCTTVL